MALPRDCALFERREMALWSFPIVCDLIGEHYGRAVGVAHPFLRLVVFAHTQLWQAMLLDDRDAIRRLRGDLSLRLQALDLQHAFADEVNDLVLDELMDVVTQRFHRSPLKASMCSHILLHIAKNLTYSPEALTAA